MTPETILGTITDLILARRPDEVEQLISRLRQQGQLGPDHLFLFGISQCLAGTPDVGVVTIKQSFTLGSHSDELYAAMGKIWQGMGEAGEKCRDILCQYRVLPFQTVGRLGAEANWNNVEPWHFSRKMTHFFPQKAEDFKDINLIVEKFITPGWLPQRPLFSKESAILTMGSCFAQELRNYLREKGLVSDWMFVPPGLNNTFALRNFVEWCVSGERSADAYWYDETADGKAKKWQPPEESQSYRRVLERISGLVLTLGLSEVWYDTATGGIFWRGVPRSLFDERKHQCRISTVDENVRNIKKLVALIRSIRADLPIIITLSPIPLKATVQPYSCVTADCVSKSTLRVAIHQFLEEARDPRVYYWPSFEIVKWMGAHFPFSMFGEDGNPRHVNRGAVKLVLEAFIRHYFDSPASAQPTP